MGLQRIEVLNQAQKELLSFVVVSLRISLSEVQRLGEQIGHREEESPRLVESFEVEICWVVDHREYGTYASFTERREISDCFC